MESFFFSFARGLWFLYPRRFFPMLLCPGSRLEGSRGTTRASLSYPLSTSRTTSMQTRAATHCFWRFEGFGAPFRIRVLRKCSLSETRRRSNHALSSFSRAICVAFVLAKNRQRGNSEYNSPQYQRNSTSAISRVSLFRKFPVRYPKSADAVSRRPLQVRRSKLNGDI